MRLNRLIDRLRGLGASVETWPGYWFSSDFEDAGSDWCLDCAEKRAEELRAEHPNVFVDGGWTQDHDSQPFCEGCERRLNCTPTDYFVEEELRHFSTFRFRKITPHRAFEIVRIVERARCLKDKEALRVVIERTVRALRKAPRTAARKRGGR